MWLHTHFHNFILPPEVKTDGNNYTAFACKHIHFTYNALKKIKYVLISIFCMPDSLGHTWEVGKLSALISRNTVDFRGPFF